MTKISKIKYEKNTVPCRTLHAFDPAKHDQKQLRIEPTMLNFRAELERASSHRVFPKRKSPSIPSIRVVLAMLAWAQIENRAL